MNLIGCSAQLWRGGLNIGTGDDRGTPANLPPVANPDAVTVPSGGSISSDVLENDVDPEGGALTIVAATADRGSVSVNPDGTLLYTAPAGFSGAATITYTVADPAGKTSQGTVAVEIVQLAITDGQTAGAFTANSAPGEMTITVTEPAAHAGEFVFRTADLAEGPVSLMPPQIAGSADVGATLTARPGLWAFDESGAPFVVAQQWTRDTIPIAGETAASHVTDAADAGRTLGLVETATTAAGTRTAESVGVEVVGTTGGAAWSSSALSGLALWLDASDADAVTRAGDEVTGLADKSGGGRDMVRVANAPTPALDGTLGGRPTLRFPRGAVLRSTGTLPGLPGMPGVTVIAVTKAHVAEGFSECFSLRNDAGASGQNISFQTGYSIMWFGNGNRYWTLAPSGPVIAVGRYPEGGTHGGTEWWRNGTRLTWTSTAKSGNAVSLPPDAYLQLGNPDGATSEHGECLVVVGPLSDADREKAEGYLAHKWGLAGALPDAHPWKVAPPDA